MGRRGKRVPFGTGTNPPGDQITHLVDLKNKTLYGSGIIVKKDSVIEHFQKAKISEIRKD